jgi:uncharacterized protein YndB with AHSA1/START domain
METKTTNKTKIAKDSNEHSVTVSREFEAPVNTVWRCYTEAELLDQWWGPAPWHAETKHMDFRVGGYWLYAMVGPNNEKHWSRMNYTSIDPQKSFGAEDLFSDENGKPNSDIATSIGRVTFTKTNTGTLVELKFTYPTEADLQKIIDMGFEQGISIGFDQLEELLKKQK